MKQRMRRRAPFGLLLLTVLAGAIVLAPAGTASGRGTGSTIIKIRSNRHPHFVVPDGGVPTGTNLRIVNKTDPHQIGPHTFSMVVPSDIPRTNRQIRHCFRGGHICRRVAVGWHEFNFQTGQPGVNPVDPGADGWDQMGRLDPPRKGDSFFLQNEDEGLTQPVSAPAGTVLHFMCVVHPFMHGKIKVTH